MRVLHLSAGDMEGGASRAAYRLHLGLRETGVGSHMLVKSKRSENQYVHTIKASRLMNYLRYKLDYLLWLNHYPEREEVNFTISWWNTNILAGIEAIKPDIVHVHWIADNYMPVEAIARIPHPVVWSMHDMNPFTGGCHYDNGCNKFRTACGKCPVLHSSRGKDLSYRIQLRKLKTYRKTKNLTMIGLSRWMADTASESLVLKTIPVVQLPNGIDTRIYKPISKDVAKNLLSIPPDKKVILFGAQFSNREVRKGFHLLLGAMNRCDFPQAEIMVFGATADTSNSGIPLPVRFLGQLHDDLSLSLVYSAADVMVVPSVQENLSNGIMESLSCGTPVVAFNIGGNPDMIQHMENGYLAIPFDAGDLCRGIRWVLYHTDYQSIASKARQTVLDHFDVLKVAQEYRMLYERILKR